MHIVSWIIVGLIAGWATEKLLKRAGYGPLMDIGFGILGAIVESVVVVCVARVLKRV
jgi:uncharacterized membrane protein YeaQ/YmgE (transglycosylase-associated protein family)